MEQPALTEPGVRFFISQTLKECKKKKDKYINTAFNLFAFLAFIIFFGLLLHVKYKGANNKQEMYRKEQVKKKYILEQIQKAQKIQTNSSMDLITNLPMWN